MPNMSIQRAGGKPAFNFGGSKLRRQSPEQKKSSAQYLDAFIYDDASISAAGDTPLFQTPQGQGTSAVKGSGAKTFVDTSQMVAGQQPNKQAFEVVSLGFALLPGSGTFVDHLTMMKSGAKISVDSVDWILGPIWFWPGGVGPTGVAAIPDAGTERSFAVNGLPSSGARKRLNVPFSVGGGSTWGMTVTTPTAPVAAVVLFALLDTKLLRNN